MRASAAEGREALILEFKAYKAARIEEQKSLENELKELIDKSRDEGQKSRLQDELDFIQGEYSANILAAEKKLQDELATFHGTKM